MKKILISLVSVLASIGAGAQDDHRLDPSVAGIGKELPRGDVVSHGSRSEALQRDYHKSRYLEPLFEWTKSDRGDAVVYTTAYKVPFAWIDRQLFLYLGKVSGSFDVAVNGEPAGYSQTGSTPSEFDITNVSREGVNELQVIIYKEPVSRKLENSRPATAPQILGEVYVLSQPKMRVRDIFVNTRMEGANGLLELGVIMKSHQLNVKDYTVYYELFSPKGELLAEERKDAVLDMRREDTVRFFANIPGIVPWSHEEPRLYTLLVRTQHEGRFKEYLSFRIGFRSLDFRDGIVYLNDTPLRLNVREFTPGSDMQAMRTQIEAMKAGGVDMLKLKGAPPSHEFYELCDETGMYLCNQADIDTHLSGDSRTVGGNPSNDPAWAAAYRDRVMNMYHTSKNSPSMIMFSLAEDSANGYNLYEAFLALKAVEKHRPVIYPEGGEWNNDPVDFKAMGNIPASPGAEWAVVTADDADRGLFRVHNTRRFTPLAGEAYYKILVGKKVVSQGSVPVGALPGEEGAFTVPIANVKEGRNFSVRIDIKTERPVNKYAPVGEDEGKKVLRDMMPVDEKDKIVIGSAAFTSSRPAGSLK